MLAIGGGPETVAEIYSRLKQENGKSFIIGLTGFSGVTDRLVRHNEIKGYPSATEVAFNLLSILRPVNVQTNTLTTIHLKLLSVTKKTNSKEKRIMKIQNLIIAFCLIVLTSFFTITGSTQTMPTRRVVRTIVVPGDTAKTLQQALNITGDGQPTIIKLVDRKFAECVNVRGYSDVTIEGNGNTLDGSACHNTIRAGFNYGGFYAKVKINNLRIVGPVAYKGDYENAAVFMEGGVTIELTNCKIITGGYGLSTNYAHLTVAENNTFAGMTPKARAFKFSHENPTNSFTNENSYYTVNDWYKMVQNFEQKTFEAPDSTGAYIVNNTIVDFDYVYDISDTFNLPKFCFGIGCNFDDNMYVNIRETYLRK